MYCRVSLTVYCMCQHVTYHTKTIDYWSLVSLVLNLHWSIVWCSKTSKTNLVEYADSCCLKSELVIILNLLVSALLMLYKNYLLFCWNMMVFVINIFSDSHTPLSHLISYTSNVINRYKRTHLQLVVTQLAGFWVPVKCLSIVTLLF